MNSSCECATFTTEPKFEITSGTALLTIVRPVAMYSNDLVGLMNSVCSFIANGIRLRSAHDRSPGGHVFQRLGRIDELGMLVHRERHQAPRCSRSFARWPCIPTTWSD